MLPRPRPQVVELTHELTLLGRFGVPPRLVVRLVEEQVLLRLVGRFFPIDLNPPAEAEGKLSPTT